MQQKYYLLMGFLVIIGTLLASGCVKQIPPQQTEELTIKSYMVEKYNPGNCFGMPIGFSDELMDKLVRSALNENPALATFIKNKYGIVKDYEVYSKIEKFNQITLTKTGYGYDFTFTDGKCCGIYTYEGKIKVDGNQITDEVTNKSEEHVPC